ncbi:hypothetical protein [Flavobacterium sp. H122]|uniref:hypothetical protein n=1 Tax=Flavobacterium sp. H122 TaxID=2529860 RepID=UPI0010AA88E4|nr:hypothetical protein [Flavobacterium sp. H122]
MVQDILKQNNITNWEDLTYYIKNIPYGRNSNREDFTLVLTEKKGTCSSKHALLKSLASEFTTKEVKLIIGIFKMNYENMPILERILKENKIEYIPEAHCYLKIDNAYFDFTVENPLYPKIENDILEEIEIEPYQVSQFKVNYHKNYIKNWIKDTKQSKSFEEIWNIRENCISELSKD